VVQFSNQSSYIFVNEAYCINPTCSCTEVTLTFIELSDDGQLMNKLFNIRVDMSSWKVTDKTIFSKKTVADKMMKEFMDHIDEISRD